MGRGRYSNWRRRDDDARQLRHENDQSYRRLLCPGCHAWVIEVDDAGKVVGLRDRHEAHPLTPDDDPYLVVGAEFRCTQCEMELRWDERDAETVHPGWVTGL